MNIKKLTQTVAVFAAATGLCIVGAGDGFAAGPTNPIVHNGKCLTPYGGSSSNGANIVQWDCNGSSTQEWWYDSQNRLRNANGKCVLPYGGSTSNGANIVQWDCNGSAEQRWWIEGTHYETFAFKCMISYGGSTSKGANMVQWDCP